MGIGRCIARLWLRMNSRRWQWGWWCARLQQGANAHAPQRLPFDENARCSDEKPRDTELEKLPSKVPRFALRLT